MTEGGRLFHPVTGSLAAIFLMFLAAGLVSHANDHHRASSQKYESASNDVAYGQRHDGNPPKIVPAIDQRAFGEADPKHKQVSENTDRFWWGDTLAQYVMAITGICALIASTASVGLVVWTFRETRTLTKTQSRAYLVTEMATVTRIVASGATDFQIHCSIDLANRGQTPAFDVTLIGVFGWFKEEEVRVWTPRSAPTSRGVIGPGTTRTTNKRLQNLPSADKNFTSIGVALRKASGEKIWARGIIRYRDVHDDWWEHSFCYELKDPMRLCDEGVGKTVDFAMTTYGEGNDLKKISAPRN